MKKAELQNKIEVFHEELHAYRELLSQSRDAMVRIVKNGSRLEEMRSSLNRKYGGLSKYIKKLGNYPMLSDIGGGPYPAYEVGLSAGVLQRRGPCIDASIQDLDYILGRLESMSNAEFDSLLAPPKTTHDIIAASDNGRGGSGGSVSTSIPPEQIESQHVKNPHNQWSMVLSKIWETIKNPIVDLAVLLVGAFLIYWLGWI